MVTGECLPIGSSIDTELREQASYGLTFLHLVHVTCSIRVCGGRGLQRLSDVLDAWWTDYSILFEVIVQNVQIPHSKV